MAVKDKIGGMVPITFRLMTVTEEEGGAHDESYTDGPRVFAQVKMINALRNITGNQLQMSTVYKFTKIRQYEGFTPDKTMLIRYQGQDLAVDSIVLDQSQVPLYYTITATNNG
jgi:oxalate decarboxylase/phosphoglucose isomerase-like protein (cupin superfamily)